MGEPTRNRFLAMLLMSVVVISVAPLVVAIALRSTFGWLEFASVFNALLSCGDLFGVAVVWWQIPAHGIVRNQGWRTYWREETSDTDQDAALKGNEQTWIDNRSNTPSSATGTSE